MIEKSTSFFGELANTVAWAFLLPGDLLLSLIARIAPQTVATMTYGMGGTIVSFVLALVCWSGILIFGLLLMRLCRRIAWQASSLIRTLLWRVKLTIGELKTKYIWKYREYFPHKATRNEQVSQTEFDEIDIAVLRSVSDCSPGVAPSAPDLANQLKLRPNQVQQRLDRLAHYNMLRSVMGETDGFENYRVTDSGLAFVAMFQRRAETSASVS